MKYQSHSETSIAAAEEIEPRVGTLRRMVLDYIRQHGRCTDEQQQLGLGLNPSTQRPRRIELVEIGLVRDSGLMGITSSGRRAVLWEAVEPVSKPVQGELF